MFPSAGRAPKKSWSPSRFSRSNSFPYAATGATKLQPAFDTSFAFSRR